MSLRGQHIIIVGGTSGMGLATAQAALLAGASVTITGRTLGRAEQVAADLSAGYAAGLPKGTVRFAALDVADETSVRALAKAQPGPDHVFVAAGSTKLAPVLSDEPLDDLTRAANDRVMGSLRVVRAFAPGMAAGSSFVLTGGLSTDRPIKNAWVSGLGTAAAEQLARVLALELAPIRLNAISPGWTDTPMWDGILGANKQAVFADVAAKWPIPRLVTADEVASAVLFLMSNRAITAEVLHIDGGQRLA